MNKSKRLAVIGIRGFPGVQGGVESHCRQLIPHLSDRYSKRVYRRIPYLTDKTAAEQIDGVEFVDLPSTRIKGFESVLHTLLCCIHLLFHRVEVVNIHNIGPGMFAPLLRLMGFKVVLTYHSPNYEHDKWNAPSKLLLRLCEKIALGCSNRIIFISPAQRAKYSPKILAKSEYIPNGINPTGTDTGTDYLEQHNIIPGKYILSVGRLTPEKGFDILVRAVNRLEEPTQLVIAGASDHGSEYADKLKKLDIKGRTVFTGFTTGSPLAQLYTHARLYALPSLNEGFPMVLLEAMSHNLPIVCSNIPAGHIIELPQERYFKRGDETDLTQALRHALMEKELHVQYDLTGYDWESVVRRTDILYDSLFPNDHQ